MIKLKAWISAARPRTLPLSVAGILTASALAYEINAFNSTIFILAILATLGFQVLSNFANDYGDGVKGTDNEERIGPARAMQSGLLTARELRQGMYFTAGLTFLISIALIYNAFSPEKILISIFYLVLGLAAIGAAVFYTVGNLAYGYKGLGDIFVFLFFGLVSVVGCFFLYTNTIYWYEFLPATTVGLLSTAVLNLNNMRDRLSDSRSGKITLAVKMGETKVKAYHAFLILGALLSFLLYLFIYNTWQWLGLGLLPFVVLFFHLIRVLKNTSPALLDPELKIVALSTFVFSVLLFIGALL